MTAPGHNRIGASIRGITQGSHGFVSELVILQNGVSCLFNLGWFLQTGRDTHFCLLVIILFFGPVKVSTVIQNHHMGWRVPKSHFQLGGV